MRTVFAIDAGASAKIGMSIPSMLRGHQYKQSQGPEIPGG